MQPSAAMSLGVVDTSRFIHLKGCKEFYTNRRFSFQSTYWFILIHSQESNEMLFDKKSGTLLSPLAVH